VEHHVGLAPGDEVGDRRFTDVDLVEAERVRAIRPRVGQVGQRAAGEVVDDVDRMSLGQQAVDERGADEAGASTSSPTTVRSVSRADPPIRERAPTTDPSITAPAPMRDPGRTTESRTTAPGPISTPAISTEWSTCAPSPMTTDGCTATSGVPRTPSTRSSCACR